jgi:hypothetical protein
MNSHSPFRFALKNYRFEFIGQLNMRQGPPSQRQALLQR